jgi:hypothetical protein
VKSMPAAIPSGLSHVRWFLRWLPDLQHRAKICYSSPARKSAVVFRAFPKTVCRQKRGQTLLGAAEKLLPDFPHRPCAGGLLTERLQYVSLTSTPPPALNRWEDDCDAELAIPSPRSRRSTDMKSVEANFRDARLVAIQSFRPPAQGRW